MYTNKTLAVSTFIGLSLFTGLSVAEINDAAVTFNKETNQYLISWTSPVSVSVSVSGATEANATQLLASGLSPDVRSLNWQPSSLDRYTFTLTDTQGDTEVLRSRVLNLEGGRNVRELGGYTTHDGRKIKWGKLYRSGALHKLTERDYSVLNTLNIATVVDFRGNEEREKETTAWQAGEMKHLTWDYTLDFDTSAFKTMIQAGKVSESDMVDVMAKAYPGLLNQQKSHYKAMFSRLMETDAPLLFHCTAGKDRTGVAAALILRTLGVDDATIMQDYVLSETILDIKDFVSDQKSTNAADEKPDPVKAMMAALPESAVKALMGTRERYLNAAFEEMRRQSGSVDAFIRDELGVDKKGLARLRAHFLE